MKKILLIAAVFISTKSFGQNVQARIVVDPASTPAATTVHFEIHTLAGTQTWLGLTFNFLYQNDGNGPDSAISQSTAVNTVVGVNDALLVTTYQWGTGNRFTNPFQLLPTPIVADGQNYTRRYIYGNSDITAGGFPQTLTTTWVRVLSITFNNLLGTYPQGGFGYMQQTSENSNVSLTDENGINVPIDVLTGSTPLGPPVTTPVLFTYFNAACNDKGALLSWETATEENADYYEIQRSADGLTWKAIDKVDAAGNSAIARQYQYLDLDGGNVQYRLRQVDIDGKETYTAIRRTSCEGKSFSSTLYPVPARDKMTLVVRSDRAVTTNLQILDMNGRMIKQIRTNINNGNTNIIIDVNSLPQGEYMLMSTDPSVRITKKFTVAR
jgi:hypothetical protein